MASCSDDTIETAALGRPFQLGMLYDCRKEALIPGITLWDQEELQRNTSVQQQNNTEFKVTTSDSIEEKSNSLKISGSLKLSLLGGLVDVGGSAKYFKDTKKSNKQARVTLQYKTTTKFETLTMSHLDREKVSYPNVFEDDTATHVVTAILYGAGAYFVFDRESSSEDKKEQVEGEAKLTFNKLKFLTVDAEASLNMDDTEKTAVEKFSCTFHGDYKLTTNPTSFRDAVRVYKDLPNMLGENGEHAVPLRVWLYPLCKLDSRAAKLVRDISNDLIRFSSDIIESLTQTEMRCRDILKDTAAAAFPALAKKVQNFMQMGHQYKLELMQKLGSVLPSIRGGGKEESALSDVLKTHDSSPFNSKDLEQWLKNKEKELDILKSYLKQLEKLGANMDDNLEDLLSDLNVENVVSFSFTSVDGPDSLLVKLSNYLKPSGMLDTSAESSDQQATNREWLSTDIKQMMRRELKLFGELKRMSTSDNTKFIVDMKYDESHPGACIFIYEDGCDDAIRFVPPSKPATPTTTDVSHDSVTVQMSGPDSATVEYRVEYREKQNQETEWKSHPVQRNQEAVTLSGLKPETEYEIRATAVGKLGYAVSSDVCRAVTLIVVHLPTQQTQDTRCKRSQFQASAVIQDIISKSDLIRSGCPVVYRLKPKKEEIGTLTRMTVGEKNVEKINKSILLVGETGTGKSTLTNALVNYAMGVRWEDEIWFQIVEDENKDQSESQTSDVIVYEIFGFEDKVLPYSLTLIDTPGYGDTRGNGRDAIVSQRLFDLFGSEDGVKELNTVGLVLKQSDNRQTDRLMYIFQSLMSLFGKDMEQNIVALITQSNGRTPTNVFQTLKAANIKCATNESNQPVHFLFDNYQHEDRTEETDGHQDKVSVRGMNEFTAFLEKQKPQKMNETVKVLNGRIELIACIQNMQDRIMLIELKQTEVEQTQEALRTYAHEMKRNETFTVEVDEVYKDKKSLGKIPKLTRILAKSYCCTVCESNCHTIWYNLLKIYGLSSTCRMCPCPESDHVSENWIYVVKTRKVQKTQEEIKKKYEDNKSQAENQMSLLESLEKQIKDFTAERSQLLEEAYRHVVTLNDIALDANSLSSHVHLDFLIEKMEEKGDIEKVRILEEMRRRQNKRVRAALKYLFRQIHSTS
ncbi:uncharacterized protein LOC143134912 isoform X1 [Alosa pseudoharengus]|uniref:uncharacterized protein LOC143134912 isoform X1 n=1 Tax=Alosa pseudoharengus TaxID=34774 RepID=UPI003F8884A6